MEATEEMVAMRLEESRLTSFGGIPLSSRPRFQAPAQCVLLFLTLTVVVVVVVVVLLLLLLVVLLVVVVAVVVYVW